MSGRDYYLLGASSSLSRDTSSITVDYRCRGPVHCSGGRVDEANASLARSESYVGRVVQKTLWG